MPIRPRLLLWAALLICGSAAITAQPKPCPQAGNSATEMGERFELDEDFRAGQGTHEIAHESPSSATRYMRVRLRVDAPAGRAWHIVVRDSAGHPIDFMSEADFKFSAERWTSRVPGSLVRFDRYVDGSPDTVRVKFFEYVAMAVDAPTPYYSYQDPKNPKIYPLYSQRPPVTLDDQRLGDSVAFIMLASSSQVWTCSGVVVAPTLLMTNWHCGGIVPMSSFQYWQDSVCKSAVIDVSWDDDGRSREFICARVVAKDETLDTAILEIEPLEGTGSLRPATLAAKPAGTDRVKLVHHPEARQKVVSLDCSIVNPAFAGWRGTPDFDFTHRCDSEGGSSGAPIFNQAGLVVGLHHHGFKVNPQTCTLEDKLNKAVRIDRILAWLNATPERQALLQQMTIR